MTFANLAQRVRDAQNEEEIRLAWVTALEATLGITLRAERGHKDLSYNNVVIEFKGPGKFRTGVASPAFQEAVHQRLLPYIRRTASSEGIDESDYIGIAIDDKYLAFAQVTDGTITHRNLLPVTESTFAMVVTACRASYRRAITSANLIEDFGHNSNHGIEVMRALANALAYAERHTAGQKVRMLFREWRNLYAQVADLSPEQLARINGTLLFARATSNTDIPARLFVVHTYNSLLTKLIAAEIVAYHGLASGASFVADILSLSEDIEMMGRLRVDIEEGGFFRPVGLRGFVEEAIFSWYLDVPDPAIRQQLAHGIREVLAALALYRMDRMPHARDVLKDFYQDLVPEVLRKALGEFYTPDWLVDFTIQKADVTDWCATRALDPTCGSGSFLVAIVQKKRAAAEDIGMSPADTLAMVLQSVWGFDLNPLAVQTSRVNVLMAIADLLMEVRGSDIEIPVLLADAVYSPAPASHGAGEWVEYQIGSDVADLKMVLPAALVRDRELLDRVFEVMGELVEESADYETCAVALARRRVVGDAALKHWERGLRETYDRVLELHERSWNGIWFRIVRNFFWSATAGRFDLVIGNPPWVRWSKLPTAYRERAKPTCEAYDIFSDTPHHGGNELDISGMITYTTGDKWLGDGGRLVFVITQTHFQSPSSQGFRRFRIDDAHYLSPESVDDMKALRPFPNAANKTSVMVLRKGSEGPTYPVPYRVWVARKNVSRTIPPGLELERVRERLRVKEHEAQPVGSAGSPWAVLRPGRYAAVSGLRGRATWVQGRKGITADLNGIFFVSVRESSAASGRVLVTTRPEAGRTEIGSARSFWVEPDLLYPLLKGASDFSSCYVSPAKSLFAFVPNQGITVDALSIAQEMMNRYYRKTKEYFKAYEDKLRSRSTWRNRMSRGPYYAVYNVGSYTFAPYKVVWAEQASRFTAAVAGSATVPLMGARPYVPDHKIFFVDFEVAEPAYYLCGLLNTPVVGEFVESHNISIQVGNIFKHMRLPAFNEANRLHLRLAELVERAHEIEGAGMREEVIDEIRAVGELILEL